MRTKLSAAAGVLVLAGTLAACNSAPAPTSSAPTSVPPASSTASTKASAAARPSGADVEVRFVMLVDGPVGKLRFAEPTSGFVHNDIPPTNTSQRPDPEDPTEPSEPPEVPEPAVDTPQPGEPTRYLPAKAGSRVSLDDATVVDLPSGMAAGERATIAVSRNADGKLDATGFLEKDGKITGEFGTSKLTDSPAPKPDRATVFGVNPGKSALTLGSADGGCLAEKPTSPTNHVAYPVTPGNVELAWYDDTKCQTAAGDPEKVTLKAGQYAYAFAWTKPGDDPQLVFVPVEKP